MVVKRATPLFNSFCSNIAKHITRFAARFTCDQAMFFFWRREGKKKALLLTTAIEIQGGHDRRLTDDARN